MSRKVIGIGETVLDIIFDQNNNPKGANPGGSVYNALISLGRSHVPCVFVSEIGDDKIGNIIRRFLIDNNVDDNGLYLHKGMKSPLSLAFLDENSDAQYSFYKDYSNQRLELICPDINPDDIILFGSYFALNPVLRPVVASFLRKAKEAGAILYYDVNFRRSHQHEVNELMPTIIENFTLADIVKGSNEDFMIMFGKDNVNDIYHNNVQPYCNTFICTAAAGGATVFQGNDQRHVDGKKITPVSTIGAGDNFNAGTVCGIYRLGITHNSLSDINLLQKAMLTGIEFATEVCLSLDNYIARK